MTIEEPTAVATPVQDPELTNFLLRLRKKNTDSESHKKTVDSYDKFWESDREQIADTEGSVEQRRAKSDTLTNHFYDLVTDFYEYGWGTSFHFARMFKDSTFKECISRHEDFLALKLNLKPGMKCLDVGCGVGGPLREVAKFSGASVTGLNNNAYQVKRCDFLAKKFGLSSLCKAVKGNFEQMPFEDNSFDAVYAIEATCHARHLENPYGEVFRVLKPGAYFACYEWLTTDQYDENNLDQKKIVHGIEEGNSISKMYSIRQALDVLKKLGFEIVEYEDLADPKSSLSEAQEPWYAPLKGTYSLQFDQLYRWRMNPLGRMITTNLVYGLETIGFAPKGTTQVSKLLNYAADSLVEGGEQHLFTPMFYFLVRKPLN